MKRKQPISALSPYKLFGELSYALKVRDTVRNAMLEEAELFGDLRENGLPHLKKSSWSWSLSTSSMAFVNRLVKVVRDDIVGYNHPTRQSSRRKRACIELTMKEGGKIYVYSKGECFDAPFIEERYKGYSNKEDCPETGRMLKLKKTHKDLSHTQEQL